MCYLNGSFADGWDNLPSSRVVADNTTTKENHRFDRLGGRGNGRIHAGGNLYRLLTGTAAEAVLQGGFPLKPMERRTRYGKPGKVPL